VDKKVTSVSCKPQAASCMLGPQAFEWLVAYSS